MLDALKDIIISAIHTVMMGKVEKIWITPGAKRRKLISSRVSEARISLRWNSDKLVVVVVVGCSTACYTKGRARRNNNQSKKKK